MTTPVPAIAPETIDRLKAIVGPKGWIDDASGIEPYVTSWRDNYHGRTPLVVRPNSTEEVAGVVALCAETVTPIVPQSGNTGLTGGGIPHEDGREIVLSLNRMNRIRDIDTRNDTMTAEAGCILAEVQGAAAAADRIFPLSLAAEGSCRIGGNLSTNAGGIQVLRYGPARDLVLGLEVVLPDGRIWNGLRGLRKDNTGYDLKQLFIGAEGTLGIVTAAVLKLFPRPRDIQTAFAAVPDVDSAVDLLVLAKQTFGETVTCFEITQRFGIDLVLRHIPGTDDPLATKYPWYVLIELWGQSPDGTLREPLEAFLADALERQLLLDATIAASAAQAQNFWRLRESMAEAQKAEGGSIKHDISVPVSRFAEFITRADEALLRRYPGIRPLSFGHIGDGNVHYNPAQPVGTDKSAYMALQPDINRIVHDIAVELGGSISAEHGLGQLRLAEAEHYKAPVELDLMRTLKKVLDPKNIMNPGKVLRL